MRKTTAGPTEADTSRAGSGRGANDVHLVGRVTTGSETRALPSGAAVVTFRIAVRRAPTTMTRGSSQKVDVVDCVAWSADARRSAARCEVGQTVEVRGSIRRRFFRSQVGATSRTEVEVLGLRRHPAEG